MRTTIRRLPADKGGVAGRVDVLTKPVQFVMQTVKALQVTIVGEPGHTVTACKPRLLSRPAPDTVLKPFPHEVPWLYYACPQEYFDEAKDLDRHCRIGGRSDGCLFRRLRARRAGPEREQPEHFAACAEGHAAEGHSHLFHRKPGAPGFLLRRRR